MEWKGPPDAYRGPQTLTSGGEMVFSTDKTHTLIHKDKHAAHSEVTAANVDPLFQSADPDIIHPPLCLSVSRRHSDALRCVRSDIHHLSRPFILYPAHTDTHTLQHATLLSPLLSKKLRDLVAKRPNAPLVSLISISHSFHAIFSVGFARGATITAHCLLSMVALSYQQG